MSLASNESWIYLLQFVNLLRAQHLTSVQNYYINSCESDEWWLNSGMWRTVVGEGICEIQLQGSFDATKTLLNVLKSNSRLIFYDNFESKSAKPKPIVYLYSNWIRTIGTRSKSEWFSPTKKAEKAWNQNQNAILFIHQETGGPTATIQ